MVDAVNVLLKLGRTRSNAREAPPMFGPEAGNAAANSAHGFVDDFAVLVPKSARRVRICGHQCVWDAPTQSSNQLELEGFRTIGSHGGATVYDECWCNLAPGSENIVHKTGMVPGWAAGPGRCNHRKSHAFIRPWVCGSHLVEVDLFIPDVDASFDLITNGQLNCSLEHAALIDENGGHAQILQALAHARQRWIGLEAPQQD